MPGRKPAPPIVEPPRYEPPKPFVGQAPVVTYFERVGPERLAHAYLFFGPRGVGKTTFARTLALTLHCERPASFPLGYCGTCDACRRGLAGADTDTLFVDEDFIRLADELAGKDERKTTALGIETSRLIVHRMQLRSYSGRRSICIIPNFENVPHGREEVYNALLKELEEPDQGKLFLLTTEYPERILPTIRSRACMVRFGALKEDEIVEALVRDHGIDGRRAAGLAHSAQGSLAEALAQASGAETDVRDEARRWVLACLARPKSLPPMPSLGKDDARSVLDAVLRHAKAALRDLLVYAVLGEDAVFDAPAVAEFRSAAAALGPNAARRAIAALSLFEEAGRIATTNVPPVQVLGWLQVQLRTSAEV